MILEAVCVMLLSWFLLEIAKMVKKQAGQHRETKID